ncbi:YcnI family protein [Arthrobacter sp. V4I6]|uniref:YcnI family copper-binding membrane protein n=1 Tax=unclassified Arthrobacter TaxID=235627 RepID=UPI00359401D5
MLAGMSGASAHVGINPDKTTANSYALLTFGVPHGCEESGTTKITITLPAELDDAQPTVNPNWTVQKVVEQLPEPKETADGATITKRTSQIIYTAKAPLEPELRDALVLSVKLPDAAGKTLYFPTLQNCEQGQTDWSEIAPEGQDAHALKAPAPAVTVTEAAPAGAGHDDRAAVSSDTAADTAAVAAPGAASGASDAAAADDAGAQARSWAALAAGFGGLVLGGIALLRSRGRQSAPVPVPIPKK